MICMAGRSGEKRTPSLRRAWRGGGCSPGAGVLTPMLRPRPRTTPPGLARGQTLRKAQQVEQSLGPLGPRGQVTPESQDWAMPGPEGERVSLPGGWAVGYRREMLTRSGSARKSAPEHFLQCRTQASPSS